MDIKPFDEVDFKHTEKLMYEYRKINDNWECYPIGNEITQKMNYEFAVTMRGKTDSMEREVQKYYQTFSKGKLQDVLSDLLKVVQRNIKIYLDKESEINNHDFTSSPEHQKYLKVHEKLRKNEIELDNEYIDIIEEGFYGKNWHKHIYEHSIIAEEIMQKYIKEQQAKDNATLKQQILILHYLGVLDNVEIKGNRSKFAKLLSYVLNRNEQNIRTVLTNFDANSIHNPKKVSGNLEFIKNLFVEVGLDGLLEKVASDMKK